VAHVGESSSDQCALLGHREASQQDKAYGEEHKSYGPGYSKAVTSHHSDSEEGVRNRRSGGQLGSYEKL